MTLALSIVSHGHGAQVLSLLALLVQSPQSLIRRVWVTLNTPEPALTQALAAPERKRVTLNSVLPFDTSTWQRLVDKGPRPAAYIFTTTYCPSCPEAFDRLFAHIQATRKMAELVVVLMDVQGAKALEHAGHYVGATRMYTFNGFESAIRQSVDPQWPNVTPYVVLLGKDGSVRRSIGVPDPELLGKWLS